MFTRPRLFAALLLPLLLLPVFRLRPSTSAANAQPPPPTQLRAMIVGGGPQPEYNQVAIESNVRYVRRLLPPRTLTRTLFADGSTRSRIVLYTDARGHDRYRATTLQDLDGPARLAAFGHAFQSLSAQGSGPLLLYFTGHGSPGRMSYDNNDYDLWGNDTLSVTRLASTLSTLPAGTPVTIVMVQCFSGAFGNLLFQGGDPKGAPINQNLCGFFASVPDHEAAGCTSEVDEADYHDFTSYFFAALSGISRLGKPVGGADYDHDGQVGMNEAFAYALSHDISIDTPVCTSDIFLRRYVSVTTDRALLQVPYASVLSWASPAQHVALEALSGQLNLHGSDRLSSAYTEFRRRLGAQGTEAQEEQSARWTRFVRLAKSVTLAHMLQSGDDTALKARYATLLTAEARNPLHP